MDELRTRLETLEAERASTALLRFTDDDVWALGTWLRAEALERGLAVVVDIRRGEQQLFHLSLPGTSHDHALWAERKARLVRRFAQPSYLVGTRIALKGQDLAHYGLTREHYAEMGGCVPIVVEHAGMVGTLALSGLPQEQDHALAVRALQRLRRQQEA